MSDLGIRLKTYRENSNYTLKDVSKKTGITDSRLCKIEKGTLNCPAEDLRKLGKLYGIPLVSLFLEAGYLDEKDLEKYQFVFDGVSELDQDARNHIQWLINRLTSKKGL